MSKTTVDKQKNLKTEHQEQLTKLLGTIPKGQKMVERIRSHQGWWRAFVLGLPEGEYFDGTNKEWKKVCNRVFDETTEDAINFLTPNAKIAALKAIEGRDDSNSGIIEESRLNYNLLSSQPLCFNFFGELMMDRELGLEILKSWWPELTELREVLFEFAPRERYTQDNSAFDVAFEVAIGDKIGLIGLECKYTDSFSTKEYDKPIYKSFYNSSESFKATYDELVKSRFNQLFRNQLIAESLFQKGDYDFVKTGLFCFQEDEKALATASSFKSMLSIPNEFKVITYIDYIENVQMLNLNRDHREWTMLLWARYCATILSYSVCNILK